MGDWDERERRKGGKKRKTKKPKRMEGGTKAVRCCVITPMGLDNSTGKLQMDEMTPRGTCSTFPPKTLIIGMVKFSIVMS